MIEDGTTDVDLTDLPDLFGADAGVVETLQRIAAWAAARDRIDGVRQHRADNRRRSVDRCLYRRGSARDRANTIRIAGRTLLRRVPNGKDLPSPLDRGEWSMADLSRVSAKPTSFEHRLVPSRQRKREVRRHDSVLQRLPRLWHARDTPRPIVRRPGGDRRSSMPGPTRWRTILLDAPQVSAGRARSIERGKSSWPPRASPPTRQWPCS